jgi:hypothetical protein
LQWRKTKGKDPPPFRFELGWLLKDGFFEVVSEAWKKENRGVTLCKDGKTKSEG